MRSLLVLAVLVLSLSGPAQAIYAVHGEFTHDAHRLHVRATNVGIFADPFEFTQGCEWPAGSGHNYLYLGGLWIGAAFEGEYHVSTAGYEFELLPSQSDPVDTIYESSAGIAGGAPRVDDDLDGAVDEERRNGRDDDLDKQVDEDFAAISDEMLSCEYNDYQPESEEMYPQHLPLGLHIYEESYGWKTQKDFYIYSYEITNAGAYELEDVVVGFFLDPDVGTGEPDYHTDDCVGFGDFERYGRSLSVAYAYDCPGDVPGYVGLLLLGYWAGTSFTPHPLWNAVSRFEATADYPDGDPRSDGERYAAMTVSLGSSGGPADMRIVAGTAPRPSLNPGEKLRVDVALVIGNGLEGMLAAAARAAKAYERSQAIAQGPIVTPIVRPAPPGSLPAGPDAVAAAERLAILAADGTKATAPPAGGSALPGRPVHHDESELKLVGQCAFSEMNRIGFTLERESTVDLEVYDATGRRCRGILSDVRLSPGAQSVMWDGRDEDGKRLPSGMYLIRLQAGRKVATTSVMLLR